MNFLANPIHVNDHSKVIYEEKAAKHKKLKTLLSEKVKTKLYLGCIYYLKVLYMHMDKSGR